MARAESTNDGPLARVGLIGDVHGEAAALEAALDHLDRAGVDRVLCVGDIVDGHLDVDRCCRLLAERAVLTVGGNHERWLLADRMRDLPDATPRDALSAEAVEFLRGLPATRALETLAGPALLCHGLGADDMTGLRPDDAGYELEMNQSLWRLIARQKHRWVLAGHTHRRMVRRIESVTFVNAGTLHRSFSPCFALIDFEALSATFTGVDPTGKILASEQQPLV